MKVTIVVGGRWHAFDLAKELQKQGSLHKLITNYPRWLVEKWGIEKERIVSLPTTFYLVKLIYLVGGESLMMRVQWIIHKWFADKAACHLQGSDVIHGWSQWSEPSFKWAKERGIPTVLERSSAQIQEQSLILEEGHRRLGMTWVPTHKKIVEMELREYNLCDVIAVPSLFVERTFKKRSCHSEKLYRNHFGVNLKQFTVKERSTSGSRDGGFRAIYAGSLTVRKGIPTLIEGFKKSGVNGTLCLIGGCSKELRRFISNQSRDIIVLGHIRQDELVKHYQNADCFVLASIEEGMAMVQIQALSCGLPLICTTNTGGEDLLRLGGARPIVENRDILRFPAGFVVPVEQPDSIAYCLKRLEEDKHLLKSMRENAQTLAKGRLSWASYAQRAMSMYEGLV